MDLSIIIINHNTKELTKSAINSIIKHTSGISFEIIVVDNSNNIDEKLENNFSNNNIRLIHTDNKGFGSACNLAARLAESKYLLFLNSDTKFEDNSIVKCLNKIYTIDNIGILGTKTILSNGKFDHSCKRGFPTPFSSLCYFMKLDKIFPRNKKIGAYHQTFIDKNKSHEVDAVSGTCMFFVKDIFESIGGFDEDFFMYGEDLDICYRTKKAGFKVLYFADAHVIHIKGQSGLHIKSNDVIFHFYESMKIFYNKHYRSKYNKIITALVMLAINIKYKLSLKKLKLSLCKEGTQR